MKDQDLVFVTIVTRDYYWWAKTWAESVSQHHPKADVVIAFADRPVDQHYQCLANYQVLNLPDVADSMGLSNFTRMAFQYTPFELTCALKPFVMNFLHRQYATVIYLDADTAVYRTLEEVFSKLESDEITATPHLLTATETGQEMEIRAAGTINGGFVATRRGIQSAQFLDWWMKKCRFDCCVDPYAGRFVDQSWLDLAVHYFSSFQLLDDETFNVAYWNLNARPIRSEGSQFFVNDRPLAFFHFSGLDPDHDGLLSRFARQDDGGSPQNEAMIQLKKSYLQRLRYNRCPTLDEFACEYHCYRDGHPIDPVHREAIRGRHAELADVLDPFDNLGDPSITSKIETIRERLVLSRKHWQLEELQKSADLQVEWIQKQINKRFDKRLGNAIRWFCSRFQGRGSGTEQGGLSQQKFQSAREAA